MTNPAEIVERYFRLAPDVDTDAYLAQFAADAMVEDEGHEYQGIDAIRAWRREVPPVSYTVGELTSRGDEHVAHAEIAGDFPGSPVTLAFGFTFTGDGHIQRLTIRP
jgi:SnoaL-like domain